MGAGCFDRSWQRPALAPLLRFVGMLGTAVFSAVIDGLRAIRQEWSAFGSTGVRWYGTSSILPVSASLTPAQEKDDFLPALLLPRYLSPRYLKDAGDSGSRALAPPVFGQGTVFIGVVLLKSRVDVIITYLLRSVNTKLILKSHMRNKKSSCLS